jgi:aminoglycoside phosphotransferase (APT) family kinase protein
VVSATNVASATEVGGHFWVFMQYTRALKNLGAKVYWLERLTGPADNIPRFLQTMEEFGLRDHVILYEAQASGEIAFLNTTPDAASKVFRRADLLLNFDCKIAADILGRFKRRAFIDIDPGLLQFWVSHGQLALPKHDVYFTTGETVGTPQAAFPDLGLPWIHVRPPVSLDLWPYVFDAEARRFTTVTSWWGDEWITDGHLHYENNKRVTFLDHLDLPRHTRQPLEIAAFLGPGDAFDVAALADRGWSIRHSREVASTPAQYRSYVQSSRGEFSCVKPSCLHFRNAWVSDRTICYLASGKPAVVQYTGENRFLPEGEGLFRFRTIEEAADALDTINRDYERHCKAARGIAEAYYDADSVVEEILNASFSVGGGRAFPVPSKVSDSALREQVERIIRKRAPERGAIASIERERCGHLSWYATYIVTVRFRQGEPLRIFMKDFGSPRYITQALAERRDRETRTYSELLAGRDLETAEYFGTEFNEEEGRLWMFLEYVPGTPARYCEFPVWIEAARWAGRFHANFASESLRGVDFLEHHDRAFFESRAQDAMRMVHTDSPHLAGRLESILKSYEEAVETIVAQPTTLVHGSFSAVQILWSPNGNGGRVCAVDWERAAVGSGCYDLVRIVDGFEPARRALLLDAYRAEAESHGGLLPSGDDLERLIECYRLDRVMRWLGSELDRDPAAAPKLLDMADDIARTGLSEAVRR